MPRKRPPTKVELDYRRERKRIQNFIRRAQNRGYIFGDPKTGNMFELPAIPKKITEASVRRLKKLTPDYLYGKSIRVDFETGEYEAGLAARKHERSQAAKRSAETMRRKRKRIHDYQPLEEIKLEAERRARRERERAEQERREREAFEQGMREEREKHWRDFYDVEPSPDLPELPNRDTLIIDRTREAWSQYSSGEQYGTIVGWLNNLIAAQGEEFAADVLEMAESAGVVPEGYEFYNGEAAERYINELISFVSQKGVSTFGMTADQMEALGLLDEFL